MAAEATAAVTAFAAAGSLRWRGGGASLESGGICGGVFTDISFDERWQSGTQEGWNDSKHDRAAGGNGFMLRGDRGWPVMGLRPGMEWCSSHCSTHWFISPLAVWQAFSQLSREFLVSDVPVC